MGANGGYIIVAGERLQRHKAFTNNMRNISGGIIDFSGADPRSRILDTVPNLKKEMSTSIKSMYDTLFSITVIDNGFENLADTYNSAKEFIALQDMMVALGMQKVKLYLVTNDSELYELLKGNVSGYPGIIYPNTEIFLRKDKSLKGYVTTMTGGMDGKGYRKEQEKAKTLIERYDEERALLEEEARQVGDEILEFDKKVQFARIDTSEYADSPQKEKEARERNRKNERKKAQAKSHGMKYFVDNWGDVFFVTADGRLVDTIEEATAVGEDKEPKIEALPPKYSDEIAVPNHTSSVTEEEIHVPVPRINTVRNAPEFGEIKSDIPKGVVSGRERDRGNLTDLDNVRKVKTEVTGVAVNKIGVSIYDIQCKYKALLDSGMSLLEDKLAEDKAIITVCGRVGSGSSGLLAQMAEVYAMLGSKVCIIDLDTDRRSQSRYFNNVDEKIAEHKGIPNALLNVCEGGRLTKAAIKVNSSISLCGLSQSWGAVDEALYKGMNNAMPSVLADAIEEFDVVLVDLPVTKMLSFINVLEESDRIIYVVENKEYEFDDLIRTDLEKLYEKYGILAQQIFANSTVVLNKYSMANRDYNGVHIDSTWVKDKLLDLGAPYDSMLVGSEIPYVEGFEDQYHTNMRYIWSDPSYMGLLKKVLASAV